MRHTYKIFEDWDDIYKLVEYVQTTGMCSHDFETLTSDKTDKKGGLKYYSAFAYPTVIGISFQPGSGWVIPLGHKDSPFKDEVQDVIQYLGREIFSNPDITKVSWNAKFEYKWLLKYGVTLMGRVFDGMLAKHLLDEERPHGLKEMVARFLPEWANYGKSQYDLPLEELSEYCSLDTDLTLRLFIFFEGRLMRKGFYPLFRNLFTPLTSVLGKCEFYGIQVDRDYLTDLVDVYDDKIAEQDKKLRSIPIVAKYDRLRLRDKKDIMIETLEDEIEELRYNDGKANLIASRKLKIKQYSTNQFITKKDREAMAPLNLGSPKQMIDLFYESERGFQFPIIEKTDSGAPSTAEDIIIKLKEYDKHGFIDGLLELRGLEKLQSTYIRGILAILGNDDLIHSNYKIHGTVTGRLSSTEPNMQNIPRVTTNPDVKKMFIAPPGYMVTELDYSQAELRIVAELAGEEQMITWFNEGHNIHVAVAVRAEEVNTGKKLEYKDIYKITKDETHPDHVYWTKRKKRAKTINFGILYGQGPPKLAETLKCTKAEAQEFLEGWLETFPRIAKWIDKQHKKVKRDGYVTNMWGMKRRLPAIYSPKFGERSEAERQSVNTPIQGAASFFTLFSAIILEEMRMKGEIPLDRPMIYTVHDSLGYYVRKDKIHEFVKLAVPVCANPQTQAYFGFQMKRVSMKASVELGNTWGELHDYDPKKDYTL